MGKNYEAVSMVNMLDQEIPSDKLDVFLTSDNHRILT